MGNGKKRIGQLHYQVKRTKAVNAELYRRADHAMKFFETVMQKALRLLRENADLYSAQTREANTRMNMQLSRSNGHMLFVKGDLMRSITFGEYLQRSPNKFLNWVGKKLFKPSIPFQYAKDHLARWEEDHGKLLTAQAQQFAQDTAEAQRVKREYLKMEVMKAVLSKDEITTKEMIQRFGITPDTLKEMMDEIQREFDDVQIKELERQQNNQ